MDRSVLEATPRCAGGMIIGAYAIGANHGYIYCRLSTPGCKAPAYCHGQARERGFLGQNIMGAASTLTLP